MSPVRTLTLVVCCCGLLAALDERRVIDSQGVQTIHATDGTVLSIERPGASPDEALYYGAGGVFAGRSRWDPVLSCIVYTDPSGIVLGRSYPAYTVGGWYHFRPNGSFLGMTAGAPGQSYDTDPRGVIVPDGLFPVPLDWTHQLHQPGSEPRL
jgi:hypothetical protein